MNDEEKQNSKTETTEVGTIDKLLTVTEVADLLRLKPSTIRLMAKRNNIPSVKVGRCWRFKRSEILKYLQ